jgi:hypothetical protein
MEAGVIPPDIGDALSRNCGCHYGGTLDTEGGYVPPFAAGELSDLTTLAGIEAAQSTIVGRFDGTGGAVMPYITCNVGGGEVIAAEDKDLLIAWLDTTPLPDGATWTPPG